MRIWAQTPGFHGDVMLPGRRKDVALVAVALVIHHVQRGALLVPARNHCATGKALAPVPDHEKHMKICHLHVKLHAKRPCSTSPCTSLALFRLFT